MCGVCGGEAEDESEDESEAEDESEEAEGESDGGGGGGGGGGGCGAVAKNLRAFIPTAKTTASGLSEKESTALPLPSLLSLPRCSHCTSRMR